jgi:hypothetical protein
MDKAQLPVLYCPLIKGYEKKQEQQVKIDEISGVPNGP